MRKWYKVISPKFCYKHLGMYHGEWMPQMDHAWESDDGYSVMSRKIRTEWGKVEHVTIGRMRGGGDIPWAEKMEIKNELFGERSVAIEVYPDMKNLVDVMDIYHLWILPEKMSLPFGIHPTRDPKCVPVERGFDCNLEEAQKWIESEERARLLNGCEYCYGKN